MLKLQKRGSSRVIHKLTQYNHCNTLKDKPTECYNKVFHISLFLVYVSKFIHFDRFLIYWIVSMKTENLCGHFYLEMGFFIVDTHSDTQDVSWDVVKLTVDSHHFLF